MIILKCALKACFSENSFSPTCLLSSKQAVYSARTLFWRGFCSGDSADGELKGHWEHADGRNAVLDETMVSTPKPMFRETTETETILVVSVSVFFQIGFVRLFRFRFFFKMVSFGCFGFGFVSKWFRSVVSAETVSMVSFGFGF